MPEGGEVDDYRNNFTIKFFTLILRHFHDQNEIKFYRPI